MDDRTLPNEPITPNIVYELVSISSPTLAPEGDLIAYSEGTIDSETLVAKSRLTLMNLPNGPKIFITDGPKDNRPKFSPNGEIIAFMRPDKNEQSQIWTITVNGGKPKRLTSTGGGVQDFEWSPGSDALAFVSDVWPKNENPNAESGNEPRVKVVNRIGYRADTLGWRGNAYRHIFTIGITGGQPHQITHGQYDNWGPKWSHDGTKIGFISARRDDRDVTPYSEAYVISAAGGNPVMWSTGLSSIGALVWDTHGQFIVAVASEDEAVGATWQGQLYLLHPVNPPTQLSCDSIKPSAGFPPTAPAPEMYCTPNGHVFFLADAQGESYLYDTAMDPSKTRKIYGGGAQFSDVVFDKEGKIAVIQASSPTSPGELRLINIEPYAESVIVRPNADFFLTHPTASLEKRVITRGRLEIESRLLKPPGFDSNIKYPLILDIHGGPHGAFYDSFNAMQQILATAGYLVLCVNPRGSSTYGVEFLKAVIGDWGGEDYLDILAAVDDTCTEPYVDTSRLGLHGYSYGGFMSSWIVGQDNRFKAAVVGAPCTDLSSMYGTSDIGVSFGERQWAGTRYDSFDSFVRQSPLTYAQKVNTPILLLHGESDHRCPIEQSEQYFVTLKRLGKEVEFVRFPGCSHLFLRNGHPKMREEYLLRTLAWFEKHLVSLRA
ncbi:S9 family peptidase [SAR202 cluster bacterium AD-804-J14_MRT_500m]|nr:S9 family peptidase [SAR202 cluster bacterium AD-804-J14_MRT_500m]